VPLAHLLAGAGKSVLLVDVQPDVVDALNRGESHIEDVPSADLAPLVAEGRIAATTDYDALGDADAIVIALPTPLSKQRSPTVHCRGALPIAKACGQHLVVLSRRPRHDAQCCSRAGGAGSVAPDFNSPSPGGSATHQLAPQRCEDRRQADACTERAALYGRSRQVRVSAPEPAELTKLLENIFRSVNIALVNELAQLCDRMNIDVWEVIDAAATKPFGFMPFKPGPGLGGHCIPIDPFYLTWKAREYGFYTEFIELAGKVNESMPYYCRSVVSQALNHSRQRSLKGSRILVLGVAYKPDISDTRESPAVKLISLLHNAGAQVDYHDPHVPSFTENGVEMSSVPLDAGAYDCVVVVTNHSGIDYERLVEDANLVVDLRNATGKNGTHSDKVWKL
jgi:UDP-N-acetyl-D-glucosamine dehydrogenase